MGSFDSLYLRHEVSIDRVEDVTQLLLALRFEEGFAAYLNGHEIARCEPAGWERIHDPHVSTVPGFPRRDFCAAVDRASLVPGRNVLAVEARVRERRTPLFVLPVLAAVRAAGERRESDRQRKKCQSCNHGILRPATEESGVLLLENIMQA